MKYGQMNCLISVKLLYFFCQDTSKNHYRNSHQQAQLTCKKKTSKEAAQKSKGKSTEISPLLLDLGWTNFIITDFFTTIYAKWSEQPHSHQMSALLQSVGMEGAWEYNFSGVATAWVKHSTSVISHVWVMYVCVCLLLFDLLTVEINVALGIIALCH